MTVCLSKGAGCILCVSECLEAQESVCKRERERPLSTSRKQKSEESILSCLISLVSCLHLAVPSINREQTLPGDSQMVLSRPEHKFSLTSVMAVKGRRMDLCGMCLDMWGTE